MKLFLPIVEVVTECPGCLHREHVNLKQVDPFDGRVLNVNEVLCVDLVGPITISSNKNHQLLLILKILKFQKRIQIIIIIW